MSNVVRMRSWTIQSFSSYTQATLAWSKSTQSQERPATETWCIPSLIALSSYCCLNNNKHGKTTCSDHLFKSNLAMVSLWAKPDCLREILIFFFPVRFAGNKTSETKLWPGNYEVTMVSVYSWSLSEEIALLCCRNRSCRKLCIYPRTIMQSWNQGPQSQLYLFAIVNYIYTVRAVQRKVNYFCHIHNANKL